MKNYSGKKQWRKTSLGIYCLEVNSEEVAEADLLSTCPFICPLLVKRTHDFME